MKSRRCIAFIKARTTPIARCQADVRFTRNSAHCIAPQRMSALCQKRTYALQQKRSLLDHLVGALS
jgi:hypothetical protein